MNSVRAAPKYEPGDLVYFVLKNPLRVDHAKIWQIMDDGLKYEYTLDIFSKRRQFAEVVLFPDVDTAKEHLTSIINKSKIGGHTNDHK